MKSKQGGAKEKELKENLEEVLEDLKDLSEAQTEESQADGETQAEEKLADGEIQTEEKQDEGQVKAEAEEEELNTKYLRLAADFQNFRRRAAKEKSDIYAFANEKIMTELLAVIDNFDRALAIETVDKGMKEGMEMIFKQLMDVLGKSGLKEISALNEEFDPNFHHAVQTIDSNDHKGGQITTVLQKGYSLNDRVIRPSMVIVAE